MQPGRMPWPKLCCHCWRVGTLWPGNCRDLSSCGSNLGGMPLTTRQLPWPRWLLAGVAGVDDLFATDLGGPGLAGVDEVGRGPLAGDVVAAAVILDPGRPIDGLRDSKKLSESRREALAGVIREQAVAWSIARATVGLCPGRWQSPAPLALSIGARDQG